MNQQNVTIVGAGLVGCAAAILLRQRGYSVVLYERGADMRDPKAVTLAKSINLILTVRGLRAMELAGLKDEVLKMAVPVEGRMMHPVSGSPYYQPYGVSGECNYSISRAGLNKWLMDKAEAAGVKIHFEHQLVDINFKNGTLVFKGKQPVTAAVVIAADGGGSAVRNTLWTQGRIYSHEDHSSYSYKEATFPLTADGKPPMATNALHIWPRGKHMLMGLANLDGSFTGTVFNSKQGEDSFASTNTKETATKFWKEFYPTALPVLGGEEAAITEYVQNPGGFLGTVRCYPWECRTRTMNLVMIGDASHGILPFFGQGLNSGLEDCSVLIEALNFHNGDWSAVVRDFSAVRKPCGDAIADMAMENFVEMRDKVGDQGFMLQKGIEHALELKFPQKFRSRYAFVVYSHNPYFKCQKIGEVQKVLLADLAKGLKSVEELDMEKAERMVDERVTPVVEALGLTLDFGKVPPTEWPAHSKL
eukprot:TRINITY_DN85412_c0_g1_i1.p1 TRINITY_DN85412_c0_g1~~TRINITY_DN85412_c0_g1_i1.p1  ORF type:complete len:475 (+),score=30.51 TRINITY_DN85412_c0_g1_i1:77-1501(+)